MTTTVTQPNAPTEIASAENVTAEIAQTRDCPA